MGASVTCGRCGRVGTSGRRSAPRPRDSFAAAVLAAGSAAADAATSDAAVAGSAAAPVIAVCAERWSGTGASGVDDEKTGASADVAGKVCAPAAQAKQAETMQTTDESDAEQFMTNRTEYVQ
ncbi:hypothetical protein [Burkholderia ambifaria]|uniref:hypothetical protein n=1 Tax=Burkholderia ambifaria TaxID=152480 RepID=UPI001FC8A018|nr:hypothetical protein [Burkholderia ambifaria]